MDVQEEPTVLDAPVDDQADDLQSTNVPESDADLGEQTWPTEEELALGEQRIASGSRRGQDGEMLPPALPGTTPRRIRKVPKGTSAYQAAWIPDDEDEDHDEGSSDEDGEADAAMSTREAGEEAEVEEWEDMDADEPALSSAAPASVAGTYADLSDDAEKEQYEEYLAQRKRDKENRDDLEFPDEIDTPLEIPARKRFARFRGLKSFRTSRWDPYENLPADYSRLFMFEDWRRMGKRLIKKAETEGVEVRSQINIPCRRPLVLNDCVDFSLRKARREGHGPCQGRASDVGRDPEPRRPPRRLWSIQARTQVFRHELHGSAEYRV
jgi:pre-rRNA-processing protein TSR1